METTRYKTALIWSVLCLARLTTSLGEKAPDPVEYCQWEIFNATCDADEIVVMTHAQYGRMRLGRCLTTDVYIGCGGDVLSQMDARCSGRSSCQLTLPDSSLHQSQPCPRDMMAYLEASYTCVKVGAMTEGQRCSGPKRPIMTNSTGILSSTAALRSGYGLPGCEWVLRAQTGQNLRISLVDFSLASRYTSDSWYHVDGDREYCYVYAVIREQDGAKEFTVCASNQRETVQYTSTTSQVEIIILDVDQESAQNFIFKYEAIGCPDMVTPSNAHVVRQGDGTTITCNSSQQAWHLVCKETQWIGEYGECVPGAATGTGDDSEPLPSYGLILAVLIGVAIGIIVGFTLLATVLWCRRRGRYKRPVLRESEPGGTTLPMSAASPSSPHCKVHRLKGGDYGYTHVWEVQASPGGTTTRQAAAGHRTPDSAYQSYHSQRGVPGSGETLVCFHPTKRDHEYESPKFETFGIGIGRDRKLLHQTPFYQGCGKNCGTMPRTGAPQCGDSLDNVVHIEVGVEASALCGPVGSVVGQGTGGYSMAGDTKTSIVDTVDTPLDSSVDPKGNHYT